MAQKLPPDNDDDFYTPTERELRMFEIDQDISAKAQLDIDKQHLWMRRWSFCSMLVILLILVVFEAWILHLIDMSPDRPTTFYIFAITPIAALTFLSTMVLVSVFRGFRAKDLDLSDAPFGNVIKQLTGLGVRLGGHGD